jgi:muramidase (phage lysozyme)
LGRYQFIPKWHPDLLKVSGAKDYQAFLASPVAQEKYMDHWIKDLEKSVKSIKKINATKISHYSDEELLALCHYL